MCRGPLYDTQCMVNLTKEKWIWFAPPKVCDALTIPEGPQLKNKVCSIHTMLPCERLSTVEPHPFVFKFLWAFICMLPHIVFSSRMLDPFICNVCANQLNKIKLGPDYATIVVNMDSFEACKDSNATVLHNQKGMNPWVLRGPKSANGPHLFERGFVAHFCCFWIAFKPWVEGFVLVRSRHGR